MIAYKNLSGDSGVMAFEISHQLINVQFQDGSIYQYTYLSAGSTNIEQMKILALQGSGLNSFINKYVRRRYSARLN